MDASIIKANITSRKRKREDFKEIIIFVVACVVSTVMGVVAWYYTNYFVKEPTRDWELERRSFLNRLYRGAEKDCIEQLRLCKSVFFKLCNILQEKWGLVRTKNVPITEAVAMFLHMLAHNLKYRVVHFSYCRSKETISRQFNNVLKTVMKVSKDYLKLHAYLEDPNENKWRWFERCIGALDSRHIPVTVSPEDRSRYRNRKGDVSTNVLAACGQNLRFIYVLPGWEGSAGDSRVLRDALHHQNKLEIPTGKYFLVDAGYTNGPRFLAPYRGTRYHLNEWIGNTPQNFKELFNLRHSSARNTIERSFGILKKRWSILRTPSFFDIKTQIRIINACFVLHNFISDEQQIDQLLEVQDLKILSAIDEELNNRPRERVQNNVIDEVPTIQVTEEWTRFRDTLAMNMFANYQVRRNIV
ncbi:hypothetical protein Fmac_020453 [Flemingia macrophylla]|uniref:Transposase n=1 Tax=Flemingia macrophylla TaxID=520843 RepID=A0ABD1LU17_9FABA